MWMTSHGQCPRGGGGACECSRVGGVFQFFGGRMTSRGQRPRGCVLANVQEWGCFSIFRRADDVTRTTSKGVCACECPRVGVFFNFLEGGWRHTDNIQGGGGGACEAPPFRKSCIRACVPPIQVQTPPPTWMAGYGPDMWLCKVETGDHAGVDSGFLERGGGAQGPPPPRKGRAAWVSKLTKRVFYYFVYIRAPAHEKAL